jgi:small subunit ribosomal protein S4e
MSGRVKRMAAPRRWPLKRKADYWAVKPSPGPHEMDFSVPLLHAVRDMLALCETSREAKMLITGGRFMVDGRVRKDYKYPVGLMDVLKIDGQDGGYRMLVDRRNRMHLVPVPAADCTWKLCRVEGKRVLRDGKKQISLHDGRNLLIDADATTGDVLRLELPSQKVLDTFRLEEGSKALLIGGSHVGELATVSKFEKWRNPAPNIVHFREGFSTIWLNVFVSGKNESSIRLPEVAAI